MAVLQMQKISICALKKNRKAILETLQKMGVMEMIVQERSEDFFEKMDTAGARLTFEKNAQQADHALAILQEYAPEKTSLFSSLAGKEEVELPVLRQAIAQQASYVNVAKQIVSYEKQIAECKAGIVKLENQKEALAPWMNLDISMGLEGTKTTSLIIGSMAGALTLEMVLSILAEQLPNVNAYDVQIVSIDKGITYLTVLCMKKDAQAVEEALRTNGFARPSMGTKEIPYEAVQDIEQQIRGYEKQIVEIQAQIVDEAVSREDLRLISDYYKIRADKYEFLGTIPQTQQTFIIEGYVPAKKAEKVMKILTDRYQALTEIEPIEESEDTPVLLQNNKFAESAEGVLASFGLPGKGELDPTFIMSIFYVFLFGLMLSDAAYGLIVSLACGIALLKFPRMGSNMRKSVQLFFWCGLSTLFWGVMFGGYFGDVINVISRTFFGHEIGIPAVWFVPLDDPMRMLVYSMLFGVIHLFFGLGVKGYMCIKDKKYMDFLCDVVFWFALLLGLILILVPTDLFASIAQTQIVFPDAVNMLAKGLAIVGALGILFFSGRSSKNFGLRIALGAYDLYNITGWLSDVLSYSRLLALGLATGVIASVVNQMGSMVGKSFFGVVVFILVFLVGHTFNIGINLLGAYVHTCRLQYVEFFGKFYEGGGREFTPFRTNTKYVDIKKEEENL